MSVYTNKGYKFTIVNGSVTAVYEIEKGRAKFEKMDSNETWSFDGSNVIKTEFEHGHTEITMFSDIDGDGIFNKVSKSYAADTSSKSQTVFTTTITPQKNGYQFDIVDGSVTAVYEIERGYKSQERIDLNETWSIDGSNIIKTEIERGITETTTYADIDGDGVFAKISKSYVSSDGSIWSGKSGTDNDDVWKAHMTLRPDLQYDNTL